MRYISHKAHLKILTVNFVKLKKNLIIFDELYAKVKLLKSNSILKKNYFLLVYHL